MPDIKEKLVDILRLKPYNMSEVSAGRLADHLIANGVTFVTDNNVGRKWISVEERLPDAMEWVLCAHADGFIEVLRYDHIMDDWDTTVNNRCRSRESVTHWMPLPEPPKGE
jgi:hypothetical protein